MTQQQAEKVANVLIGAAVAGAAFYVLRDRTLRRTVWQAARTAIAASGPWLMAEAGKAWSGSRPPGPGDIHPASPEKPDLRAHGI